MHQAAVTIADDALSAGRTLPDVLERTVCDFPGHKAIDFLGRSFTWRDIGRDVERMAAGLQSIGVKPGDRVGLCLPNTPYSVVAYYAVLRIGGIVVNYNPLYVEREIEHQIRDSGTSFMVVIDLKAIHAKVAAVAARTGLRKIVLCRFSDALTPLKSMLFKLAKRREIVGAIKDDLHVDYADLLATKAPPRPVTVSSGDVALLQYTGGTTGTPKAAALTHGNLVANAAQNCKFNTLTRPGEGRVLGVIPLFHVFAMTVVMNCSVMLGSEMILLPRFVVADTLKAIMRRKPTMLPAVPTLYAAIAKAAQAEGCDLSFIESCISGGAPLPKEIGEEFMKVSGAKLVEGYGLTEASPTVTCNPFEGEVRYGSIGIALPGTTIEIRDPETRALVPTGERGEIVVRGPQVMKGYWNKPDETAKVLDEHGLRTGDIGTMDADGYIFVVDRIKDLIISGGYNVYPRTIEDALYQHPAIAEAIVIGIPDPYRGQSAKAFVVLKAGEMVKVSELEDFLESYLSKIERPKEIEIRAELPKTAIGKLSRKELVAEDAQKRAAGARRTETAA